MGIKYFSFLFAIILTTHTILFAKEKLPVPGEPFCPTQLCAVYPYPASTSLCDGWNVFTSASFIYWSNHGFTTGIASKSDVGLTQSEIFYQKSSYQPGFKVGIGTSIGAFDCEINYLRCHNQTTSHFTAGAGQFLTPLITQVGLAAGAGVFLPPFNTIESKWKFDFDDIRFLIQSPGYYGKNLILSLGYGLDLQWQERTRKIQCSSPTATGSIDGKQGYIAIGPLLGTNVKTLFPAGFRVIGDLQFTLDYMYVKRAKYNLQFPSVSSSLVNGKQEYDSHTSSMSVAADAILGLGWENYLANNRYHINFMLGYEWYGMWFVGPGLIEPYLMTNVCFHGLTLSGRMDF